MQEHTARENRKNEKRERARMSWKMPALCSVIFLALAGSTRAQQNDNTNNLLPPKAKARLGTLRFGHIDSGVSALAFSPDGQLLASLGRNGFISIWDAQTGNQLRRFGNLSQDIQMPLAFSGDGKFLVVKNRQLWEVAKGKHIQVKMPLANAQSYAISVAPDGKSVATAMGQIFLRKVDSNQDLRTFGDKNSGQWTVLFSPDGRTLIGGAPGLGPHTIYFLGCGHRARELRKIAPPDSYSSRLSPGNISGRQNACNGRRRKRHSDFGMWPRPKKSAN